MSKRLREKMPMWLWAILITLLILVPVLVCIHVFGIMDLSFTGTAFLGFFTWAGTDVLNGVVAVTLAALVFGALGYYIKGFKGTKLPTNTYNPLGQQLSQTATDDNTVIS